MYFSLGDDTVKAALGSDHSCFSHVSVKVFLLIFNNVPFNILKTIN